MTAQTIADTGLQLGQLVADFMMVKRVPRWANDEQESDVEHSYMLALIACELASAYYPKLNTGLIAEFSNVHDLVEVKVGDTPTFLSTAEQLTEKAAREDAALHELQTELPAHTVEMLTRYEQQQEPEARFVRIVDKMTPAIVNIVSGNLRPMHEDYSIYTSAEFLEVARRRDERLTANYPDFPEIIEACKLLHQQFALVFEKAKDIA
jgi:5'-deoxynucleotidase YfbR-like HD superfamily hydrolase